MTEKPRILVIASTYPRFGNDHEPRFIELLCRGLASDYEVDVLAPHAPNILRTEQNEGVTVYRFRYAPELMQRLAYDGGILANLRRSKLNLLLVPLFILGQLGAATRLLRKNHYALIHAHWIVPQGLVAVLLAILSQKKAPVLLTSHGGDLFGLRGRVFKWLKRQVIQRASHLTVVSEAMKEYCIRTLNIDPQKVSVRSMGVDLLTTFTSSDSLSRNSNIVFVGRLVEKKGLEYLIKAMVLVSKAHPDAVLTVVGDGPLKQNLMSLTHALGVSSRVFFAGGIPNANVPKILQRNLIAVLPFVVDENGDQEGLGLVTVEALGCECAVVASNLPAVRDVITHGETGLLAEPAQPESLAAHINFLLENPEYARRLAVNGRKAVVERFDWRVVGREYSQLIKKVIGEERGKITLS